MFSSNTKKKNIFLDFFPPPVFLKMPATGINISDHSIKIMTFVHGSRLRIKKFGDEPIPEGVIKSGSVINTEALKEILRTLKKKYDLNFIRVSLPEEKAYVFKTKIPKVETDFEIRSSIEFQLEDNVPISVTEAIFDYTIIPGDNKNYIEVGVSVLPEKVIASYIGIFEEVGLVPLSFEIEAESIARAVIPEGDLGTYMIVDYGRTRTGFSVVSGGVVRYTSTAEIGGEPVTEILMKQYNLSKNDADIIKNERGLIKDGEYPDLYMSLANIVSVLKDEINKRYIFWHTHKNKDGSIGDQIKKIILVGGNSNLMGLEDYLSSSLKVKVEKANVWSNAVFPENFVPPIDFNNSLGYASAVGLALRELK
jgi:type IV pilus assembly protein PilM